MQSKTNREVMTENYLVLEAKSRNSFFFFFFCNWFSLKVELIIKDIMDTSLRMFMGRSEQKMVVSARNSAAWHFINSFISSGNK
jgi:hypothetical protein